MFKLFESSQHTNLYSKFRPTYPTTLYDKIFPLIKSSTNPETGLAILDVACGSGQASFDLAQRNCQILIGVDPSNNQIANAQEKLKESSLESNANIYFEVAKAEELDAIVKKYSKELKLESKQDEGVFDLITVAQGLHWFDFPQFFQQVDKYLKKGGVFAAWCYVGNRFDSEKAQQVRNSFYDGEELKPFWSERRKLVDDEYRTIPNVPYPENVKFDIEWKHTKMSIRNYMNYIRTWSAVNAYGEKHGLEASDKLLDDYQKKLMEAFEFTDEEQEFDYHIPYHLLLTWKP